MTRVPAYYGPLYTKANPCPFEPNRVCWYDRRGACEYYQGTAKTSARGYSPAIVLCSAPIKKGER